MYQISGKSYVSGCTGRRNLRTLFLCTIPVNDNFYTNNGKRTNIVGTMTPPPPPPPSPFTLTSYVRRITNRDDLCLIDAFLLLIYLLIYLQVMTYFSGQQQNGKIDDNSVYS